jgi:hypothetical protein
MCRIPMTKYSATLHGSRHPHAYMNSRPKATPSYSKYSRSSPQPCLCSVNMSEPRLATPDDHLPVSNHENNDLMQPFPLLQLPSELRNTIYEFFVADYMETVTQGLAIPSRVSSVHPYKLADLIQCFTVCQEFRTEIGRIFIRDFLPKINLVFNGREPFLCFLNTIGTRYPDFKAELHLQSGVNLTEYSRPDQAQLDQGARIVQVVESLEEHPGADFSMSNTFGMPSGPVTIRDGAWEIEIIWYISPPETADKEWLRRHAITLKGHLGRFDLVRRL